MCIRDSAKSGLNKAKSPTAKLSVSESGVSESSGVGLSLPRQCSWDNSWDIWGNICGSMYQLESSHKSVYSRRLDVYQGGSLSPGNLTVNAFEDGLGPIKPSAKVILQWSFHLGPPDGSLEFVGDCAF